MRLGLEALANAVSFDLQHGGAYTSDRENCLFVAAQYDRAAQSIGWTQRAIDSAGTTSRFTSR